MAGISVIIPAYNRANLLPQTLRSLLEQTLPACEILVVDDGSTDGTAEIAGAFGSPVRVIRQANAGPAAARNRGWREAVGDYLHFFDSDDLALPNKHEVQFAALNQSRADIAYGPWVKGQIGENSFQPENLVLQQQGIPQGSLVRALLTDWSVVPHACLFRRSIVEKVGGFPEELFVGEDQLMFLRCLLVGARVVHSPGTMELYRTNDPAKITATGDASKARHCREWARFLVLAQQECLKHDINPSTWFGFRQRVWQARRDLKAIQSTETDLLEPIEAMLSGRASYRAYALSQWLETKRGGLQRRLTGGRAHHSFRIGRITNEPRNLIAEMGLELQAGPHPLHSINPAIRY